MHCLLFAILILIFQPCRMPFSIKRFAHLHRSQSVQDGPAGAATTSKSSDSSTAHHQSSSGGKSVKASSVKHSKKSKKSSDSQATLASAGNSVHTRLQANPPPQHQPPPPQYQPPNPVPPSFVICNQSTLNSGYPQPQKNVPTQAPLPVNVTTSTTSVQQSNTSLATSRSFDSNEMRRFVHQSSKPFTLRHLRSLCPFSLIYSDEKLFGKFAYLPLLSSWISITFCNPIFFVSSDKVTCRLWIEVICHIFFIKTIHQNYEARSVKNNSSRERKKLIFVRITRDLKFESI